MDNRPPSELISDTYRDLNRSLHENPKYGTNGHRYAGSVATLCENNNLSSVLDYGCGKGTFAETLRRDFDSSLDIREYDPCIPGKDQEPVISDLVFSSDVLEHIEPDLIENVVAHMAKLARKMGFLIVNTKPALKTLPDGRNAHLIIEDAEWWQAMFEGYFKVLMHRELGNNLAFICVPLTKP